MAGERINFAIGLDFRSISVNSWILDRQETDR